LPERPSRREQLTHRDLWTRSFSERSNLARPAPSRRRPRRARAVRCPSHLSSGECALKWLNLFSLHALELTDWLRFVELRPGVRDSQLKRPSASSQLTPPHASGLDPLVQASRDSTELSASTNVRSREMGSFRKRCHPVRSPRPFSRNQNERTKTEATRPLFKTGSPGTLRMAPAHSGVPRQMFQIGSCKGGTLTEPSCCKQVKSS
jgi:hypothetical protein